ncbi:MAG: hypothetical protein QXU09_02385 [Thermoproteota archaeon]
MGCGRRKDRGGLILRKVLETCTDKPPILVDKGPRYLEALTSLNLKWRHVTLGVRNRIERWFSILKAGTKRFNNNFPNNSTLKSTKTLLEAFITLHNALLKIKT